MRSSASNRGVTTSLGYALSLLITSLLVSGLLIAGGSTVDTQQRQSVSTELRVVGQQLAADVTATDRLVLVGNTSVANTTSSLPPTVAGTDYTVTIAATGGTHYELTLQSVDPEQTITVTFVSTTPVDGTTVDGGRLTITYDDAANELVVAHA